MNDDISKKLIAALPEILPRIYPNGKIKSGHFMLGSLMGEPGDSLRINMKSGIWCDFADPSVKGKIIGLFVNRNGSMKEGMKEIIQLLKLPPPIQSKKYKKPKVDWREPLDPVCNPVWDYLRNERGIEPLLLGEANVRATAKEYVFIGIDEDGELAYAQYTAIKRDEKGKKVVRFSDGPKLCLWGMDSVSDKCDKIIITEGMLDAISIRQMGFDAVSIPSGAASDEWIQLSWNFLEKYAEIILNFDSDEPGQKAAQHAAGRIGAHRCKNMRFTAKDANAALLAKESIHVALANCTDFFPSQFVVASDVKEKIWNEVQLGPQEHTGIPLFGWQGKSGVVFRIRGGESTIWTGYGGSGKSTALLQHAAYTILKNKKKVAIASLEVPSATSLVRMITQAAGHFLTEREEFDKVYEEIGDNLYIYDCVGSAKLQDLLSFFEYCIQRHGVSETILDSLMRTDIDIDGDKSRVAEMFQTVIDSCSKTNAHYHIVAHAVKGDDTDFKTIPTMNSVKGIQELTANIHNVIVCWQNKIKKGTIEGLVRKGQIDEARRRDQEWGDSRLVICKNRIGQTLGKIEAWFDESSYRFREVYDLKEDQPYIRF